MKIIILGAGEVGATLADSLIAEKNDITIVDCDPERVKALQERLDIRGVIGYAAHPEILIRAGIEDANLLIAVTSSDETNMIACQIAYTLFRTPTKIARVRANQYLGHESLFGNNALPVDVLISPEKLVTEHIFQLIEHPNALQVLDFAQGKVKLVAVKAFHGGPLVGHQLKQLKTDLPNVAMRVIAIYRDNIPLLANEDTYIKVNDEVFFITDDKHIEDVIAEMRQMDKPNKRIMIAGGGNIGSKLAKRLEEKYFVKIIDKNRERCQKLSLNLNNAIVLKGNAADRSLLLDENISDVDVFCALTNQDEANILSAILAKHLGAKKVMALINRPEYIDVVGAGKQIDIAISPQQTTISRLLTYVRRGDVVKVHSLKRGLAEAIEAIAHGDSSNSAVVGKTIKELSLPPATIIAAIVRDEFVMMVTPETKICAEDHIILFLSNKKYIKEVEKLFQVGFGFF